jgi:tetratricopeptide (TPR) repeat protein
VVLCLSVASALPAGATDDPFADGVRAYRGRDFAAARELFVQARARQPDSGPVLFNLGLSEYQLGDFAAARRCFLQLRRYPELTAVAEYHLGLVAARVGQFDRAAAHLRAASAGGSAELRRLAQAALQMLSDRPVARVPAAYVLFAAGADSNRNRLDDDVEIPGRDAESAYTELSAVGQYPLRWGKELELRGSAFQRDYGTDDELDQRSLGLSLRNTWRLRPWTFSLAAESETVHLDTRGLVNSLGLGAQAVRRAGGSSLRLRYQPARVWADPDLDYLEGSRQRLDVAQEFQWGGMLFSLGYELEDNSQAARGVEDTTGTQPPLRHGPYLRLSRAFTPRFTADLNLSYRHGRFEDPDLPQLSLDRRIDELYYLGSALRWRIGSNWGLRLDYRYADNRSTLEVYDYRRHMLQAGLDWRY